MSETKGSFRGIVVTVNIAAVAFLNKPNGFYGNLYKLIMGG